MSALAILLRNQLLWSVYFCAITLKYIILSFRASARNLDYCAARFLLTSIRASRYSVTGGSGVEHKNKKRSIELRFLFLCRL
jgi:hypothetical protein